MDPQLTATASSTSVRIGSDPRKRWLYIMPVVFVTYSRFRRIAYAFLVLAGGAMYAPYGPSFAIIPEMVPGNVAGEVTALINSCGALGSSIGSWVVGFLQGYTGNSRAGYLLMSISLFLSGLIIFLACDPSTDVQSAAAPTVVRLGRSAPGQ